MQALNSAWLSFMYICLLAETCRSTRWYTHAGHIPYRSSKLTRLLQDSLGGNTKTVMIANLGPADWNYDESVSTLRYANRAKNIKNKPKINEDPKDSLLRQYQEEATKLREALERGGGGGVAPRSSVKKVRLLPCVTSRMMHQQTALRSSSRLKRRACAA